MFLNANLVKSKKIVLCHFREKSRKNCGGRGGAGYEDEEVRVRSAAAPIF